MAAIVVKYFVKVKYINNNVCASSCRVVHTDTDLSDPMVQQAKKHHLGSRAGLGER